MIYDIVALFFSFLLMSMFCKYNKCKTKTIKVVCLSIANMAVKLYELSRMEMSFSKKKKVEECKINRAA